MNYNFQFRTKSTHQTVKPFFLKKSPFFWLIRKKRFGTEKACNPRIWHFWSRETFFLPPLYTDSGPNVCKIKWSKNFFVLNSAFFPLFYPFFHVSRKKYDKNGNSDNPYHRETPKFGTFTDFTTTQLKNSKALLYIYYIVMDLLQNIVKLNLHFSTFLGVITST